MAWRLAVVAVFVLVMGLPARAVDWPIGRFYRSMLYQTSTNGVRFGIEATSGRIVWKFATHGPKYTRSTPAADPSGTTIYAPGVDGKVHKLDAATGRELRSPGFPARITRVPNTEAHDAPLNVANGYVYATLSAYNDSDALLYLGHVVGVNLARSAFGRTPQARRCSVRRRSSPTASSSLRLTAQS